MISYFISSFYLVSTRIVHFISSTYYIGALCSSTITDCSPSVSLLLFGWWVILSSTVALTWWLCVSACGAGTSGSDTAVLLEFLSAQSTHCPLERELECMSIKTCNDKASLCEHYPQQVHGECLTLHGSITYYIKHAFNTYFRTLWWAGVLVGWCWSRLWHILNGGSWHLKIMCDAIMIMVQNYD